jgi:hypothetical protein
VFIIKFEIQNKVVYSLLAVGILIIAAFVVIATNTQSHDLSEITHNNGLEILKLNDASGNGEYWQIEEAASNDQLLIRYKTDAAIISNFILTHDGDLVVPGRISGNGAVPTGAVMYFNLNSCPSGWHELIAARGRYMVGVPSPGSLGASMGNPLTDLESRTTGQHLHKVNPGSTTTNSLGNHQHGVYHHAGYQNPGGNVPGAGGGDTNPVWQVHPAITSLNGDHSHQLDIPEFDSGSTGTAGTVAPYLQFLVCQKD